MRAYSQEYRLRAQVTVACTLPLLLPSAGPHEVQIQCSFVLCSRWDTLLRPLRPSHYCGSPPFISSFHPPVPNLTYYQPVILRASRQFQYTSWSLSCPVSAVAAQKSVFIEQTNSDNQSCRHERLKERSEGYLSMQQLKIQIASSANKAPTRALSTSLIINPKLR